MASAPLAIGKSPVPALQNVETDKPVLEDNISVNQSDKLTFPQAMKKVKGDDGVKKDDSQTGPLQIAVPQEAATVLPLPGMNLPLNLAQEADPGQIGVAISGNPAIAVTVNGESPALTALQGAKGRDGKGGMDVKDGMGVRRSFLPVDHKAASMSHAHQQPTGDAERKSSVMPMVDDQRQIDPKSNFSVPLQTLQDNHQTAGTLGHSLASETFEKHTGITDTSSRVSIDAANELNGLIQGTNKVHQTSTMPPAISASLKTPEWGDELNNRVVWMVQQNIQTASIKINPPHLGPLEVHVSMNKDHVDVLFNSHHVAVKDAIDASIPKLREMLGNSGMQLGDANVAHHSSSGQSQYSNQGSGHQYFEEGDKNIEVAISDNEEAVSTPIYTGEEGFRAIDYYV